MEAAHVQEMSPKPLVSSEDGPAKGGERLTEKEGVLGSLEEPDGSGNPKGLLGLSGLFFAWISFPSNKILAQFWFVSVSEQAGCSECGSGVMSFEAGVGHIALFSLRRECPRYP